MCCVALCGVVWCYVVWSLCCCVALCGVALRCAVALVRFVVALGRRVVLRFFLSAFLWVCGVGRVGRVRFCLWSAFVWRCVFLVVWVVWPG